MDMTGVRLTELVEAAGCAAKIAPGVRGPGSGGRRRRGRKQRGRGPEATGPSAGGAGAGRRGRRRRRLRATTRSQPKISSRAATAELTSSVVLAQPNERRTVPVG